MSDLAIAHWGEHCNGGAERVAWELQRTFDAPLYVGHRDPGIEPDDVDVSQLFSGGVAEKAIKRGGFPRAAAYFWKWALSGEPLEQLREFETLITSGNETLFYCGPDTQTRVHYTHHTSRRHTDLLHAWDDNKWGTIGRGYAFAIRQLLNNATNRPDLFVANSEPVARRIEKYWGIPEERIRVVYPPIETETYSSDIAENGDYYVHLGRLDDWHKHISDIIDAVNETQVKLKIAGTGPDEAALKAQAADNVDFLGYVSEEHKRELLSGARAMIFAGEQEDFGISTAEALASGTPVIAPHEGFTKFQVRPGFAGITFHDRDNIRAAIVDFEASGVELSPKRIERHAEKHFGVERFRKQMRDVAAEAEKLASVDVDWDDSVEAYEPTERATRAAADGGEYE